MRGTSVRNEHVHPEFEGESKRLKPCPFCGSNHVGMEKHHRSWFAKCFWCNATGPNEARKDHAAGFWNRRKES